MNKREIIQMVLDKINLEGAAKNLASTIIENTLNVLEENYSKYTESKKETESNIDAERIAKLIEYGFDEDTIKSMLERDEIVNGAKARFSKELDTFDGTLSNLDKVLENK